MVAAMKDVQDANDNAQTGMEPENNQEPEGGNSIVPQSTEETTSKIREVFAELDKHKQDRKTANENLSALREDLAALGFSKKAQKAVGMYMNLNEKEQEHFDQSVGIMRAALGKPVQGSLELVHSSVD